MTREVKSALPSANGTKAPTTNGAEPPGKLAAMRIVVVDDHPLMRFGLRMRLHREPDMQVVGEAADGPSAVETYFEHRPDVMMLDLRLPGMNGPEVIAAIRKREPNAKIIVFTSYDADENVYRAVQAGARGYILKGTFAEGIIEAIRSVHAGLRLIAPEVASRLADRVSSPSLTTREISVVELAAKGLSNKGIGAALFVSETTIKYHLKNIYTKLGVSDRTEAAYVARQRGIIEAR